MSRNSDQWTAAPNLPTTHYVSGDVYSDPDVFQDEREKLFNKIWRLACHESELSKPGDFRTIDHVGTPLIVIRGVDGVVRTFVNTCSHRGAKIIHELSGNAERLTCFYHLWTYDTLGTCIDIPRPEGYATSELRSEDCGLRELRTETKLGLVFVNLDDAAPSLDAYLAGALERFDHILGGGDLEVFHFNRAEIHANWKAWMETNVDAYHTLMHVALRRTQIDKGRKVDVFPNGHVGGGGQKMNYDNYRGWESRTDSLALPGAPANDMRTTHLFPNSMVLSRGTVIRIDTIVPIDQHRTMIEFRGLGLVSDDAETRATRIRHHNQFWGPFGRNIPEDAFAAEACAASFGSGAGKYQIIARDENMTGQDDVGLRTFYGAWGAYVGRSPHAPSNG